MASSGMLLHVALVITDVSEEFSASFIRVTRIGDLGTTLAVTSNRRTLRRNTLAVCFPVCSYAFMSRPLKASQLLEDSKSLKAV
jgi:hypothetical protein